MRDVYRWTPVEKGNPELPGFYFVTVNIEGKLLTTDGHWDSVSGWNAQVVRDEAIGWRTEAVGDKVTAWMEHPDPYLPAPPRWVLDKERTAELICFNMKMFSRCRNVGSAYGLHTLDDVRQWVEEEGLDGLITLAQAFGMSLEELVIEKEAEEWNHGKG